MMHFFMTRLLGRCRIINPLQAVSNGQEAIDYLKGVGRYADRQTHPLPILMLLDLKMPVLGGLDVLRWLQTQTKPAFPIVVLTSMEDLKTMAEGYRLGAHTFFVKPIREEDFLPLVKGLQGIEFAASDNKMGA